MKEDWRHVQPAFNHDIRVLTDQVVIVWDDGICSAKTTDLEAHRGWTAFVDDKEDRSGHHKHLVPLRPNHGAYLRFALNAMTSNRAKITH